MESKIQSQLKEIFQMHVIEPSVTRIYVLDSIQNEIQATVT